MWQPRLLIFRIRCVFACCVDAAVENRLITSTAELTRDEKSAVFRVELVGIFILLMAPDRRDYLCALLCRVAWGKDAKRPNIQTTNTDYFRASDYLLRRRDEESRVRWRKKLDRNFCGTEVVVLRAMWTRSQLCRNCAAAMWRNTNVSWVLRCVFSQDDACDASEIVLGVIILIFMSPSWASLFSALLNFSYEIYFFTILI